MYSITALWIVRGSTNWIGGRKPRVRRTAEGRDSVLGLKRPVRPVEKDRT